MIPNRENETISYVKQEHEPYSTLVGKAVEVRQPDQRHGGIYRGLTINQQLVIQPHISFSITSKGESSIASWNNEPCYVSYNHAFSVYPQKESDLLEMIRKNNLSGENPTDPACLI